MILRLVCTTMVGVINIMPVLERSEGNVTADVASHPTNVSDEELFSAMDLNRPGLERVRAAVERLDYAAAGEAWAEYFRHREKPTPHFSRDTWPAFIKRELPQLVEPILSEADDVTLGKLEHGSVSLPVEGREIKWLHNPTRDTNYISLVGSQWFLNPLGRAYLLSGDEKYARTFAWVFESWYDHQDEIIKFQGGLGFNPVYHAYYPGIRARILVDNYYCTVRSAALTPRLQVKLMKHILACASWLYAHEQRYRVGNQQVAAVLGMGIVGLVFPELKDAEKWVDCATQRMREHLQRDFFDDGGHKELCTQYHKTCLRDMAYVSLTAERNGRRSLFDDEKAAPAFERAYEWLSRLVMPTGETPALHSAVFSNDWAVHLLIAARYFKRPDFLWLARRFWDQGIAPNQKAPLAFACFLVNEELSRQALADITPKAPTYRNIHLQSSGFAIMRTGWGESDRYLVFQYGWANTGHAYPGALAFCLEMNGELVATNPGSPRSYRHPAYRYCHSTPSHNVVSIDMKSYRGERGIAPGGKLHILADMPSAWFVSGQHEGYQKQFGATHARSILMIKNGPMVIRDIVNGAEGHNAQWNFHTPLSLSCSGRLQDGYRATLKGRKDYTLSPAFPDQITEVKMDKRWEAVLPRDCQPDDCGKVIPVLRYEKPIGPNGAQFCVALTEGEGGIEALSPRAFRVTSQEGSYMVLYRDAESEVGVSDRGADIVTDAACACVQFKGDSPCRAWVIQGKSLTISGAKWLDSDRIQAVEIPAPGE